MPDGRRPGGAPLNVAMRLASLGIDTDLLSRVGDDEAGRALTAFIAANGVATRFIQRDTRYPTGVVHVDATDPHAVRYDIAAPAAWDFIDADEFLAAWEGPVPVLVYGSLAARDHVTRESLLRLVDRTELPVFDVNLRPPFDDRPTVEDLLHRSRWAKLNEAELALVGEWASAGRGVAEALPAIASHYGLEAVCVTLGGDGALLWFDGRVHTQEPFRVEVVDTIGCGDAFLAAWLAGMLGGATPPEALLRGSAVGALVAAQAGANPVVTAADIDRLIGG